MKDKDINFEDKLWQTADKITIREEVRGFIPKINSQEGIFELFKRLNYPKNVLFESGSKRKLQDFDFKEEIVKDIKHVYTVLSFEKDIPVFLFEVNALKLPLIRYITKKLSDKYIRFLLILTSDYETVSFVFPEYEKVSTGEHKIRITRLNINRSDLYWTDVETIANLFYEGKEASWRDVWRKWKEAFSVEKVTEKFFEDYKNIFFLLRNEFLKQKFSRKDVHEFTLQFLNRIMFLYFISKKKWLNEDVKFMKWLWNRYLVERNKDKKDLDSFYDNWLKQIFFKAFNNRQLELSGLPDDVKEILERAPYLNGGLFTENETDKLEVRISDSLFRKIFEFYESYNFTIKEDMPLEQEVAVDPQMIGYVYESLANVAEEIYDRNDLGIFYTPRVEVDFMCRRTLVEYLSKNMSEIPKEQFYKFVFDADKEAIEKQFDRGSHWRRIEECLDNLSVVDPACGSGAFLVGMLSVLYELYKVIYRHIRRGFSDFSLKEEIVGRSIYGVDVMPWAAHAAELRLWLQLIVETELSSDELRKKPLLPNLNLNIRVGDSLVQEIGGLNLHFRTTELSPRIKNKLVALKSEKGKYFLNLSAKFTKREQFIEEEAKVFEELIEDRINTLLNDARILKAKIERLKGTKQFNLYGGVPESEQKKLFDEKAELQENFDKIESQIDGLRDIRTNLKKPEKKPFIWDIDFAEIFGDKGGFDIVIGNPPYVRQEMISPPNRLKAEISSKDRQEYKEKLLKSVTSCYSVVNNVDKKSDYYIYFYFHGLSLLNPRGTFCFITSNSWLDVDYGKELQEFLLKYVPIIAIIDSPKRSFKHSDINTVIALFSSPQIEFKRIFGLEIQKELNWPAISNTAKFIMFKKPFSEVVSSKYLLEIENIKVHSSGGNITDYANNVVFKENYRVFPVTQSDLMEDAWEYPEIYSGDRFKTGEYVGNMWGGKYLYTSELLLKLLGHEKLCNVEHSYGQIRTVAWSREGKNKEVIQKREEVKKKECLHLLKSPKDTHKILIRNEDTKYCLVNIRKLNNRLVKSKILIDDLRSDTHLCRKVLGDIYFTHAFHALQENDERDIDLICGILNSSFAWFMIEKLGRRGLGGGAIRLVTNDLKKVKLFIKKEAMSPGTQKRIMVKFQQIAKRPINNCFVEMGLSPNKPIREQDPKPLPDRAELDEIIFNELGLTKEERKEVYYSVCELVKERLDKAKSLKGD